MRLHPPTAMSFPTKMDAQESVEVFLCFYFIMWVYILLTCLFFMNTLIPDIFSYVFRLSDYNSDYKAGIFCIFFKSTPGLGLTGSPWFKLKTNCYIRFSILWDFGQHIFILFYNLRVQFFYIPRRRRWGGLLVPCN